MKTWFHYMLALMMLVTGSVNTLTLKAADREESVGSVGDGYSSKPRAFAHPFVQAWFMFMGEVLCLIFFNFLILRARGTPEEKKINSAKPFNRLLLALPAMCDMTATSLMYVGLNLTYASVFQMLRGSVVIFTGIFSVLFLKRKLSAFHWVGMAFVLAGTAVVGSASVIPGCKGSNDASAPNPTVGNIIIVLSQIVVAVQMVVEEKFISGYDIPALQVVGWEGTWGFLVLGLLLIPMYYIPKPAVLNTTHSNANHFEDAIDAFKQIGNSVPLALFLFGNVLSIAFFNFSGVSVTKHLSAATRMVLDSLRTVVIWAFSLAIGWQSFCWVEVLGFLLLLFGSVVYNDIVRLPYLPYPEPEAPKDGNKPLLDKTSDSDEEAGLGLSVNHPGQATGGSLRMPTDPGMAGASPSPLIPRQEALMTPSMGRQTAVKMR